MKPHPRTVALLAFLAAGCTTIDTQVVPLTDRPAARTSEHVDLLLAKPKQPYRELARIETRGRIGVPEQELLAEARLQARQLGADALLRLESQQTWLPPVNVRDTWYDKRLSEFPFHGWGPWSPWGWGPFGPDPAFRTLGGGYSYTVKSVAIQYLPQSKQLNIQ